MARQAALDGRDPAATDPASKSDMSADARTARVGSRLRILRAARNLTIAQVAESAGLTKGFLSRLERDQTSVSIAALLRICDVLGTTVGALFEETATPALLRAGEAPVVDFGGRKLQHVLQTPASVTDLRVLKVLLAPGATAGREEYSLHGGTEFVSVLSGKLVIELDTDEYVLESGDCLTFPGTVPHTYRNGSRRDRCELFWAIAPAPTAWSNTA